MIVDKNNVVVVPIYGPKITCTVDELDAIIALLRLMNLPKSEKSSPMAIEYQRKFDAQFGRDCLLEVVKIALIVDRAKEIHYHDKIAIVNHSRGVIDAEKVDGTFGRSKSRNSKSLRK